MLSTVLLSMSLCPTHTHTHPFNGPLSGTTQVRWYQSRKVKPVWILLKQETASGSGISWAICKSAHRSRQITMPAPHHSVFYRPGALPATQPTVSKHWRHFSLCSNCLNSIDSVTHDSEATFKWHLKTRLFQAAFIIIPSDSLICALILFLSSALYKLLTYLLYSVYVVAITAGLFTGGGCCTASSDAAWWKWHQCSADYVAVRHNDMLPKSNWSSPEHCASDWPDEQCSACPTTPASESHTCPVMLPFIPRFMHLQLFWCFAFIRI